MGLRGAGRQTRRKFRKPFSRKQVSAVRSIVQGDAETKHLETVISIANAVAGTGVVLPISLIATGDTDILRDGSEILVKTVQINVQVMGDADMTFDSFARIMLIQTMDCKGVLPVIINDIMEADDLSSFRDWDHRRDHRVLWNKVVNLPMRSAAADNVRPFRYLKFFKRFKKGLKVNYIGNTNLIASASRNQLFVMVMVNQVLDKQPTFAGFARLTFKDF